MNCIQRAAWSALSDVGFEAYGTPNDEIILVRPAAVPELFGFVELHAHGEEVLPSAGVAVVRDPLFKTRRLIRRGLDLSALDPMVGKGGWVSLAEDDVDPWTSQMAGWLPEALGSHARQHGPEMLENTALTRQRAADLVAWFLTQEGDEPDELDAGLTEHQRQTLRAWEAAPFVMPVNNPRVASLVAVLLRGLVPLLDVGDAPRSDEIELLRLAADRILAGAQALRRTHP